MIYHPSARWATTCRAGSGARIRPRKRQATAVDVRGASVDRDRTADCGHGGPRQGRLSRVERARLALAMKRLKRRVRGANRAIGCRGHRHREQGQEVLADELPLEETLQRLEVFPCPTTEVGGQWRHPCVVGFQSSRDRFGREAEPARDPWRRQAEGLYVPKARHVRARLAVWRDEQQPDSLCRADAASMPLRGGSAPMPQAHAAERDAGAGRTVGETVTLERPRGERRRQADAAVQCSGGGIGLMARGGAHPAPFLCDRPFPEARCVPGRRRLPEVVPWCRDDCVNPLISLGCAPGARCPGSERISRRCSSACSVPACRNALLR